MCQVYAYSYQQRNDIQETEPYKSCASLMEREFGNPAPTYAEALTANPAAMGEHFLWSLRLLPYGIQLTLFNGTSGPQDMNPDYIPTSHSSVPVGILSVGLAVFVLVGLSLLWRQRREWWDTWLRERSWGWIALICLGISVLVAIFLTRPRAAYMFNLTVLLLAVTGMCAMVMARRWPKLGKLRAVLPVAALGMLIALAQLLQRGLHHAPERKRPPAARGLRPARSLPGSARGPGQDSASLPRVPRRTLQLCGANESLRRLPAGIRARRCRPLGRRGRPDSHPEAECHLRRRDDRHEPCNGPSA